MDGDRWLKDLGAALGQEPADPDLFRLALTHASFANEVQQPLAHNERLEFLGDAVLGLVMAETLFLAHPQAPEGTLSRMRAALVCEPTLARVARRLGLGSLLRLGHGEEASGGRDRPSVLANALEALIGALYLSHGLAAARAFVARVFAAELEAAARGQLVEDFKTALQELCQRLHGGEPAYRVVAEEGPDHARVFTVEVALGGRALGRGSGRSKKEAEQQAAEEALRRLGAPAPGG